MDLSETKAEKLWKNRIIPFGNWNYGYDDGPPLTHPSFQLWGLTTLGTFSVDWRKAITMLGTAILIQENFPTYPGSGTDQPGHARIQESLAELEQNPELLLNYNHGISWVRCFQAGFLLFEIIVRRNFKFLIWTPLALETLNLLVNSETSNTKAHLFGLVEGFALAFLLKKAIPNDKSLF